MAISSGTRMNPGKQEEIHGPAKTPEPEQTANRWISRLQSLSARCPPAPDHMGSEAGQQAGASGELLRPVVPVEGANCGTVRKMKDLGRSLLTSAV